MVAGLVFGLGAPYTVNIGLFFTWMTICIGIVLVLAIQGAVKLNKVGELFPKWKPVSKADNWYMFITCVCEVAFLAAFGYFITAFCFTVVQVFWYVSKGLIDKQLAEVKGE